MRIRTLQRRLPLRLFPTHRPASGDRDLAERLLLLFERERDDRQGLQFFVKDGTVAVYGVISPTRDRDLVLARIRNEPGVTAVEDHLVTFGTPVDPIPAA